MQLRGPRSARVCLLLSIFGTFAGADQLPSISAQNLLGAKVELPSQLKGKPAILCIGFSRSSQTEVKHWTSSVREQLANSRAVVIPIAVLEDAPKLIRGMIVHGIKGDVPPEQRSTFLVLYQNEKELKQAAGFTAPDDAYILLMDELGTIQYRLHGDVQPSALHELTSRVTAMSAPNTP
jgi:hypothetical protein